VVSSQFDWSDLGSFESVYDYLVSIGHPVDENGYGSGTNNYTAFIGDTIFVYTYGQFNFEKIFTGCQSVYTYGDNSDLLN
jgi:mannose-1-phosphate guanylyltransferase